MVRTIKQASNSSTTRAAGSGEVASAEKRAAEEDRSLASYISQLIVGDAEKKGR